MRAMASRSNPPHHPTTLRPKPAWLPCPAAFRQHSGPVERMTGSQPWSPSGRTQHSGQIQSRYPGNRRTTMLPSSTTLSSGVRVPFAVISRRSGRRPTRRSSIGPVFEWALIAIACVPSMRPGTSARAPTSLQFRWMSRRRPAGRTFGRKKSFEQWAMSRTQAAESSIHRGRALSVIPAKAGTHLPYHSVCPGVTASDPVDADSPVSWPAQGGHPRPC